MAGIRVNMAGTRAKSALLWCVSVLAFFQGFFGWPVDVWGYRGEPSSHSGASTKKNITLVRGYLPPTYPDTFTPLPDHQLPMDVLFIPGFEDVSRPASLCERARPTVAFRARLATPRAGDGVLVRAAPGQAGAVLGERVRGARRSQRRDEGSQLRVLRRSGQMPNERAVPLRGAL